MNRLSRRVLLVLAIFCAIYAVLFAANLHSLDTPILHSKLVWLGFGGTLFFAVAAWRFAFAWRLRLLLLAFSVFMVEAILQISGWAGILPGVNTKVRIPYGRVYWTAEGFSNSIRNRYGWNFPAFDLKAPRKIVAIGDSFVEAVEVDKHKNHAALLREMIRPQDPGTTVLGLGNHGTSPAQHIEILRYAQKHFSPQEALLFIYLGNDITDSSPDLNPAPPESSIYYSLEDGGQLTLYPQSVAARDELDRSYEVQHRPLFLQAPLILYSHCMTLQTLTSIRDTMGKKKMKEALMAKGFNAAGLNPAPFEINQSEKAKRALATMIAELRLFKELCDAGHIQLRIVDIPFFPQQFYQTQHGAAWTCKIGDCDYLLPDRAVAEFARSEKIPFLSLAEYMVRQKRTAEEIHDYYLSNGIGHFSEAGHRMCAEAVFDAFYAKRTP